MIGRCGTRREAQRGLCMETELTRTIVPHQKKVVGYNVTIAVSVLLLLIVFYVHFALFLNMKLLGTVSIILEIVFVA